ncbi:MAG: ribonuclease HII [Gammaproteobacteria bacterium]|nr:ribonuclease HII [Gammaproteobacteria bacterium]MBP9729418.1 ribonuclease HII [Gammaproteobacteria bacterium]
MLIAGVDEAGRGPLAGPVISAAVILDPKHPIQGLKDSKQLSMSQREALYKFICDKALAYGIGRAEVLEIDTLNILQATLLSMLRAVLQLSIKPTEVYIDGQHCPILPYPTHAIIKGDSLIQSISAASIIAKVTRDRLMMQYHQQYPGYGFDVHKGYPTALHRALLASKGPCAIHRQSFAPVKAALKTMMAEESI